MSNELERVKELLEKTAAALSAECDKTELLCEAIMDPETWSWWESLKDEGGEHEWGEDLVYYDLLERTWYVVCTELDAVARVTLNGMDPFCTLVEVHEAYDDEEAGVCRPEGDGGTHMVELTAIEPLTRIMSTAEDVQAFRQAVRWEAAS